MKATENLIGKVWTLEYEQISDSEIRIIRFSRNDIDGYENEQQYPRMCMHEDDKRNVLGVYIMPYEPFEYYAKPEKSTYFKVVNPGHVFSFDA